MILSHHLKLVLPTITCNILLLQELVYQINKKVHESNLVIKLDMTKAYVEQTIRSKTYRPEPLRSEMTRS